MKYIKNGLTVIKNNYKKILLGFLIIIIAFVLVETLDILNKQKLKANLKNESWLRNNVAITKDESLGDNIYKVIKNENITIYNVKFQKIVDEKIDLFTRDNDDIIVIYNPYGTNNLSVNVYFKDEDIKEVKYKIKTDKQNIKDFERTLVNNDNSSYELIGLFPGYNNEVIVTKTLNDGSRKDYTFNVDLSNIKTYAETKLKTENGTSKESLTDGLYSMLGNDSDDKDYLALYDNDGVIRSEIPIIGYRAHAILFNEDKMYFSISQTKIAEMNNLGRITKIYKTGDYQLHHDYTFDKDGNLLVLANNTKKETEEDTIIKIDKKTGKVTELLDFEDIFKDYVDTCTLDTKSARDEGEDGLDWLHLNSIEYVDGDVIVSSRETSSIIKISNIEDKPKLEYILSNDKFWQETDFEDYVYQKKGDFLIHAGQHSVRYSKINEDEYYLTFFNNNYGVSNSQPDFDYSTLGIKNNNPFKGDKSYYYVYKVSEKDKTFELVSSFDLEYSGIVSSVQNIGDNIVTDSGTAGVFAEYDKDYNLIRKYKAKMNKYMVYRVLKYDFNNFWFK